MSVFVWSINAFGKLLMSRQRENGSVTLILNTFLSSVVNQDLFLEMQRESCSQHFKLYLNCGDLMVWGNTPVITMWDFGETNVICF